MYYTYIIFRFYAEGSSARNTSHNVQLKQQNKHSWNVRKKASFLRTNGKITRKNSAWISILFVKKYFLCENISLSSLYKCN